VFLWRLDFVVWVAAPVGICHVKLYISTGSRRIPEGPLFVTSAMDLMSNIVCIAIVMSIHEMQFRAIIACLETCA
jgi:hypothetical protein